MVQWLVKQEQTVTQRKNDCKNDCKNECKNECMQHSLIQVLKARCGSMAGHARTNGYTWPAFVFLTNILLVIRVNLSKPHTIAWSTENVIEHDKLATPCHCALTLRVALNKSWPWCLGPYLQWCIHQVAILGLWIINKLLKPNLKLAKAKGNTTLKLGLLTLGLLTLLTLVLTVTQVYVFVNLCQETALPPKPQNYEL